MNRINKIRLFLVEFLAICLIVLVTELLSDVFVKNDLINKEIFLKTLYRALRIAIFIRTLLFGLEYFDKFRKKKKST